MGSENSSLDVTRVGSRIVEQIKDPNSEWDTNSNTLAQVFSPLDVPEGFKAGSIVICRFTGRLAIVAGCRPIKGKDKCLFMMVSGHAGATPFVTDSRFIARWRIVTKEFKRQGDVFSIKELTKLTEKFPLCLTGYICSIPVDVVILQQIGLATGFLLREEGSSSPLEVLGVAPSADTGTPQLFLQTSMGTLVTAKPGQNYVVIRAAQTSSFKCEVQDYRIQTYSPQQEKEDLPLVCEAQYWCGGETVALYDADIARCEAYFAGLGPGDLVNQRFCVVGMRKPFGKEYVELHAMNLDNGEVTSLPEDQPISVALKRIKPPTPTPWRQPSLRPQPFGSPGEFVVPKVKQDLREYTFNFSYAHRDETLKLVDPEALYNYGLKQGQRFLNEAGKLSTVVGVGIDSDGVVEIMFEVDGVFGMGAYSEGTKLKRFPEANDVEVSAPKGAIQFYTLMPLRWDLRIERKAYYKFGETAPKIKYVDNDVMKCMLYFGFKPGQRICNKATVVGIVEITGLEVPMVAIAMHTDGTAGATVVGKSQHFWVSPDMVEVQYESGKPLTLKPQEPKSDVKLDLTHRVEVHTSLKMPMNAALDIDPARCEKYFSVKPGQRLNGVNTFLGMCYDQEEVCPIISTDGNKYGVQIFDPMDCFASDKTVPLEDQPAKILPRSQDPNGRYLLYKEAKVDPKVPIKQTFPHMATMSDSETAQITCFDVDPERVQHYFPGFKVGQVADAIATVLGMAVEKREIPNPQWEKEEEERKKKEKEDEEAKKKREEAGGAGSKPPERKIDTEAGKLGAAKESSVAAAKAAAASLLRGAASAVAESAKKQIEKSTATKKKDSANKTPKFLTQKFVSLYWLVSGYDSAVSFTDGTLFRLEDEIQHVEQAKLLYPIPTGATKKIKIPPLHSEQKFYNLNFKYIVAAGASNDDFVFVDPVYLEKTAIGIRKVPQLKLGTRVKVEHSYGTFIGVGPDGTGIGAWFHFDGHDGAICLRMKTEVTVFTEQPTVTVKQIPAGPNFQYHPKQELPGQQIRATKPVKMEVPSDGAGGGGGIRIVHIDTDPDKCKHYFGYYPGQMANRMYHIRGMLLTDVQTVDMVFQMEGEDFCILVADGQSIITEDYEKTGLPGFDSKTGTGSSLSASGMSPQKPRSESTAPKPIELKYDSSSNLAFDAISGMKDERNSNNFNKSSAVNDQALENVKAAAATSDANGSKALEARFKKSQGIDDPKEAVEDLLNYLKKDTPIVSFFQPFKLIAGKPLIEWMTEDIMLRNLFDIASPEGGRQVEVPDGKMRLRSSPAQDERAAWERKAFKESYDISMPLDRVKYGVVNLHNDPRGQIFPVAQGDEDEADFPFYGDCYLVLSGIRDKTTVTPKRGNKNDTQSASLLGSGMASLLDQCFEPKTGELEKIAKLAAGQHSFHESNPKQYLEAQVHANVYFERNVSHLVISNRYMSRPNDLRLFLNFASKNGIWLNTMDCLVKLAEMRLWSETKLWKFIHAHSINATLQVGREEKSVLVAGPVQDKRRELFEKVVEFVCMQNMASITSVFKSSGCTSWAPEGSLQDRYTDDDISGDTDDDEEDEEEEEDDDESEDEDEIEDDDPDGAKADAIRLGKPIPTSKPAAAASSSTTTGGGAAASTSSSPAAGTGGTSSTGVKVASATIKAVAIGAKMIGRLRATSMAKK